MSIIVKPPTPKQSPCSDSRLKVHLRLLTINGRVYRIVTLRPGTAIVFSTNFFHQTWHIVTSQRGAHLLARLLWGLSYERHPGTLVLIHGEHLASTPFEAERSDPFLFVPAGLTHFDASACRSLKNRLPHLGPPTKTIRWHTFGLDNALQPNHATSPVDDEAEQLKWKTNQHLWKQERMTRIGGMICYSAPAPILREQALLIHRLRVRKASYTGEMDYHFLARSPGEESWHPNGEVQIFADYMDRVAAAREARQALVEHPNQAVICESLQEGISRERDRIKSGRKLKNRRRIARGKNFRGERSDRNSETSRTKMPRGDNQACTAASANRKTKD
jgi:hypothetical protein